MAYDRYRGVADRLSAETLVPYHKTNQSTIPPGRWSLVEISALESIDQSRVYILTDEAGRTARVSPEEIGRRRLGERLWMRFQYSPDSLQLFRRGTTDGDPWVLVHPEDGAVVETARRAADLLPHCRFVYSTRED